jgi:hypothetical protein
MLFCAIPKRSRRWSIWFFLAHGHFAAKTPDNAYWISLDFLGFSRQNRDLSMGYTDFSAKSFSRALLRDVRGVGLAERGRAMGENTISHGYSVTQFLLFCNP